MSTYKVMVTQIVNNENIGSAVLTTDFTTLENAISTGNERRLNSLCPVEVREYTESKNNIISFDARDTGVVIHRDVSGIIDAIQEAYRQSDNVFSEMLDFILEYQDDELHAAALCLTDEEINRLLEWAGDDEWHKCRYDSSEVCHNKDCFDCVLDKIKSEIRALSPKSTTEDAIDDPIKDVVWKILTDVLVIIRQHNIRKTEKVVKMRDATPEERVSIDEYIKGISKQTGVDFEETLKQESQRKINAESENKVMNITDINFAIDVLEHPQSGDESDINMALNIATKVLKAYRDDHTESKDMGEVSDGYHTFNQLYYQRAVLFATIVNSNKDRAWKSFKHFDGEYCFDNNGEWFIVGVDTPEGSYTYHYSKEYWYMFNCKELERGKEWDGHTEEDVTRLLSLEQEPKLERRK